MQVRTGVVYRPTGGRYGRNQLTKDDLPKVDACRLRALRIITPDMDKVSVTLSDGATRTIELINVRFPNGGSWSLFICPNCRHRARILRLTEFGLACHRCDGYRYACERRDEPPDLRIARLRAHLNSKRKITNSHPMNRPYWETEIRRLLIMKRKDRLARIAAEARRIDRAEGR